MMPVKFDCFCLFSLTVTVNLNNTKHTKNRFLASFDWHCRLQTSVECMSCRWFGWKQRRHWLTSQAQRYCR